MESEAATLDEAKLDVTHSSQLKPYLTEKVKQFQAGCIKSHFSEWTSHTIEKEILESVSGLSLEFSDNKLPHYPNYLILEDEFKNLLWKDVIKESQHEEGEVISPIFLVPKS